MGNSILPLKNQYGYYEMRLESVGGLGANLCGKLLGELGANYLGLNAASFSGYGSEKRGSPVKAYIRWSDKDTPIRVNSPVQNPHVLGLFHEEMAGKLPVTTGIGPQTKIIVNTNKNPEETRKLFCIFAGEIYCIDALKIAMEGKTRINMVMLGAISKAIGFISLDTVLRLVKDTVGDKYPQLLEQNLEGVRRGFSETQSAVFCDDGSFPPVDYQEDKNRWGYVNAPIGGINPHIGSTVTNDLSTSRQGYIPLFLPEKCIHCGLCDSVCPDMVIQFGPGEYKGKEAIAVIGLDYHHCKGCLRCVEICPSGALVPGLEREHPKPEWFVRNQDLVADHLQFEDVGANSWVTSESYLDEKRIDGGLV